MTAADVSTVTGLDTPSVSSQLSRLEKTGYVEAVSLSKTRKTRSGYQVSERFFNIWYLMRNGPRRMRQAIKFLTIFLRSCFNRGELHEMAKDKLAQGYGRVESTLALAACIGDSRLRERLLNTAESCITQDAQAEEVRALVNEIRQAPVGKGKRGAKADKDPEKLLLEQGRKFFDQKEYDKAEVAFRQAIMLNDKNPEAWWQLGHLLHYCLQRHEEAEVAYRKSIALDSKQAGPWWQLGNLLQYDLERFEEAEQAYRQAISLNKDHAGPWGALGDLLQDHLGRFQEAEDAYHQAIAVDEKWPNPWGRLGDLLYIHIGRYEEAEAAYLKSIALDDKQPGPWIALGKLYQYHLQRFEEADSAYRQAILLNDKDSRAWGGLGNLLQYQFGRYEEAEQAYRQAISLSNDLAGPWGALGDLLQDYLGRYEEAEDAYRQAIALDGMWPNPWGRLGDLFKNHLCRYSEAEAAYWKAIELDATQIITLDVFGNFLQDYVGRYDEAFFVYQQGLNIQPQDTNLLTNSAYLCALHLGRVDQAREYAKQAEAGLSLAGQQLLKAMLAWSDGGTAAAQRGWAELHQAVTCDDPDLWTNYLDDMQRILAYAASRGDGPVVLDWMAEAEYPLQFAPLYHAFKTAMTDEDHLLSINPEVRGEAEKIYRGLARMLALYKRDQPSPKRKVGPALRSLR